MGEKRGGNFYKEDSESEGAWTQGDFRETDAPQAAAFHNFYKGKI